MRLVVPPGVFRPHSDSWLLARQLRGAVERGSSVADLCTGSGLLAVTAALAGATSVTAVDVSRRAIVAARLNALLNRVSVEAVRGDLLEALDGRRFDVIVSNPPYVPAAGDALPTGGPSRAWDAGRDGRALLDRICVEAPAHLHPGGTLLLVHSDVCDAGRTVGLLAAQGLEADVVVRERGPLGPLLGARRAELSRRGVIDGDARTEELVVVRGLAPDGWSPPARWHRDGTADSRVTRSSSRPRRKQMSILDKITGRAKKAAGDIAGDPALRKQGRQEERKGEAKQEATEAQQRAERKQSEADDLERRT